jgi:hypothetical protein
LNYIFYLLFILQTWPVVKVNEINTNSGSENSQRLEFLIGLYTDIEKLSIKITNFPPFSDKVENFSPSVINLLNGT